MNTHFHKDPQLYWKIYEKDPAAFQVAIVDEHKKFVHYKLTTKLRTI